LHALLERMTQRAWIGCAVLLVIAFWAYAPALQNGYIWDDDDYVVDNVQLRTVDGLYRIWAEPRATPQYYPLVHTTFWIEYQLWGLAPLHFHVVNVLLHALGAILLWRCLRRLALAGSFVAACVFALHPVQVESVAWVTERKNVLCGVFYFAAALWLLPVLLAPATEPLRARLRGYGGGLVLFMLAMLSKTVACVLGPVLLVIAWWKLGAVRRRELLLTSPLFAIGAALGLLTVWLERKHTGAEGPEWAFSLADRCIIAGRSLVFYMQSLVWPGERVFMPPRWQIDAADPAQYVYPASVLLVLIALFALRARIGRGPLAAALIFAGTLFPALGFFNIYPMRYAFAFDHFQYLAAAAPIALAAGWAASQLARFGRTVQGFGALACAALLAVYGALSWRQSHVYYDAEPLWRHTIEHNPQAWIAHRHLGGIVLARGDFDEAIELFSRAAELRPQDEAAHNNLAIAYSHRGAYERAIAALERSAQLRPNYPPTYHNLAVALSLAGREADARAMLARYQRMTGAPDTARAQNDGAGDR
jgi:hypothetical protein